MQPKMKQMKRDYEVGYGKPPHHTRFTKVSPAIPADGRAERRT